MPRPNILLVLCDSARADSYRANGGSAVAPAFERLCAEGVNVPRFWSTTPICHPSRASLITGLYPHAHGMITNGPFAGGFPFSVHDHVPTLPGILREAGYRTGYAGQMHIVIRGWDDDRHETTADYHRWLAAEGYQEAPPPERRGYLHGRVDYDIDHTREGRFAARGLELLDDLCRRGGPWFMQLDFDGPHPACWVPGDILDLYDPATVPLPATLYHDLADRPDWIRIARDRQGTARLKEADWRGLIAAWLAMETLIDRLLGRLLDRLDEHGVAADTIVLFTSDHATPVGCHGFSMHGGPALYESVLRVPLAVRWPNGLPAGEPCVQAVRQVDLVPTLLDLAGIEFPGRFHGVSAAAALRGEGELPDDSYHPYSGNGVNFQSVRAYRHGPWKLVYNPNGGDELYDLDSDPDEVTNLCGRPEVAAAEAAVRRAMLAEMTRVEDPLRSVARRDLEV